MDKSHWIKKLKEEIIELEAFRKILIIKNPTYPFLYPTIENATYNMVNLLTYLEEKNPHLISFHEDYFYNRNIAMHKAFLHDLHSNIEVGLVKIREEQSFPVINSSEKRVKSITERISVKLGNTSIIDRELGEIIDLAGKYPSFNDNLEPVLLNISSLSEDYKKAVRAYFHGLSVLRNNVSHPNKVFSDSERARLVKAKLSNAFDEEGNLTMTFEGYKLFLKDIISFFDMLYANL